jgi:mRNA-degrading endonuclease toxin of MazEF toxin-antitoxin module
VVIIPFSAKPDALRFPGTALIQPTKSNGLTTPSVALVFQLGACDVRRFGGRIGQFDDPDLATLRDLAKRLQKL